MEMTSDDESGLCAILLIVKVKSGLKLVCHTLVNPTEQGDVTDTDVLDQRVDVLEKALGAERWSHGTRLEVTLGSHTFLSRPEFSHDDGTWSIKPVEGVSNDKDVIRLADRTALHKTVSERDFASAPQSFGSQLSDPGLGTSLDSISTKASGSDIEGMSMFQIAFAVRTTTKGNQATASDIYEHLVVPLTDALRHLQEQNRFVEVQSRQILAMKARARSDKASDGTKIEVFMHTNELVWAFKEICTSIAAGEISSIRLNGMHMTLQLPQADRADHLDDAHLSHLAVLLLEDRNRLVHELDSQSESAALAFFLTHVVPTKSLAKLAIKLNLPLTATIFLAKHLVKWRKARLISPLHARNTYVVDPNAPLDKLTVLSTEFAKVFPTLPSLESMMATIGASTTIVYGSSFPSRAHRDTYMDILTWLVRHNLVTRMRTTGWLCMNASLIERSPTQDSTLLLANGSTAEPPVSQGPALVLHPTNPRPEERHFLRTLIDDLQSKDLDQVFHKVIRHLDGEHTLEDIALLEGLKRAKAEECLTALRELDALRTIQCL